MSKGESVGGKIAKREYDRLPLYVALSLLLSPKSHAGATAGGEALLGQQGPVSDPSFIFVTETCEKPLPSFCLVSGSWALIAADLEKLAPR